MMIFKYLALAIVLEVIGSGFLQASNGFSKIVPTIIMLTAYCAFTAWHWLLKPFR